MSWIARLLYASLHTAGDQLVDVLQAAFGGHLERRARQVMALPEQPASKWLIPRLVRLQTVDGCITDAIAPADAYQKLTLPKGLPQEGQRVLAIENEPHLVSDFNGVIESGYGAGTKTLLSNDVVIVKVGKRKFAGKMNLHFHEARVAGPHYDLVVQGVKPGTKKWELHVPRGPFKGRYAFNSTQHGMIVVPMKDRGVVIAKPDYALKPLSFLSTIDPQQWIIEQKIDGSLANAAISENQAIFRSHREGGETYYDRLPALENLSNQSRFWWYRKLFPGPGHSGTLLRVELYHPLGAATVGGILNALPQNARKIQAERGPVVAYGWDILKHHGRDVSRLPYRQRRALLEQTIRELRWFNPAWRVVPKCEGDPHAFWQEVIAHGLPFGEGLVLKRADAADADVVWPKIKQTDYLDLPVVGFVPGTGKYADSLGALVVANPITGAQGEVGSFAVTDQRRQWIWDRRDALVGTVAKVRAQELTERGVPRAGVFIDFHEGKGRTEASLLMYTETMAAGDEKEAARLKYSFISSAGWRKHR